MHDSAMSVVFVLAAFLARSAGGAHVHSRTQPRICMARIPTAYSLDMIEPEHPAHGCFSSQGTSRSQPFGEVLTIEQDLWSTNQYSLEFWYTQEIRRSPLLREDCAGADIVYVPLTTLWQVCDPPFGDIQGKIANFTANLHSLLPYVTSIPHFMVLPRVSSWSGIDLEIFFQLGFTMLTIEGESRPEIVEIPYPGFYHHHAGLQSNRFIDRALQTKEMLAYECFATEDHKGSALELRQALLSACLSAPQDCLHAFPGGSTGHELNQQAPHFYQNASAAWFCVQPVGHSVTRRSVFDCLLAGSIPCFFDSRSLEHFPWSDLVDPLRLVLILSEVDVPQMYSKVLKSISLRDRKNMLNNIANVAHLYQYSLTPRSGLISWANIDRVDKWDDAFTFGLKSLLRRLSQAGRLR